MDSVYINNIHAQYIPIVYVKLYLNVQILCQIFNDDNIPT